MRWLVALDLEAIRGRVQTMTPRELLEAAGEVNRLLAETERAIRPLDRRLQAIPLTDRLSPEAQKTTTQLLKLKQKQDTLRRELEIYTAALKAYGLALED